ncbi:MAG: molybdopterin-dependent oxidoreductase [Jatrophihabitans sp.]|uniref:molybdopterin-dependent oxidoreductase n=1 Tax=Jatrophihabitans sp. TaxID=1932789 RepID=UPI003F800C2D
MRIRSALTSLPKPRLPEQPPALWPRFRNPAHTPAVAARVGRVLGICFGICFVTGLLSRYQYRPWSWLPEPATPVWGYRLTQGVHVITGIAAIPLLLVKLWTVYPRLFVWPPVRNVVHALERASVAVLVATSLLQLTTGFLDVVEWYPWQWDFVLVHRELAFVAIGALLVHIAVQLPVIREALAAPLAAEVTPLESPAQGIGRRGLLVAVGMATGTVVLTTAGQTVSPLRGVALLAPRRPERGPSGVPINKTAAQAGVLDAAADPSWRLTVRGRTRAEYTLARFEALPATTRVLPMACVEGWSVSATWTGPRLLDLVRAVGGTADSAVRVTSLERSGSYRTSIVDGPQLAHALLATHLNGDRLTMDHGYPVRLIAPDRAGVLNTKWITDIEVL